MYQCSARSYVRVYDTLNRPGIRLLTYISIWGMLSLCLVGFGEQGNKVMAAGKYFYSVITRPMLCVNCDNQCSHISGLPETLGQFWWAMVTVLPFVALKDARDFIGRERNAGARVNESPARDLLLEPGHILPTFVRSSAPELRRAWSSVDT